MKTLFYITLILTLYSCITPRKCAERFPPKTIVENHYTEIRKDSVIPSETLRDTIYIDSIRFILTPGEMIKDTSANAELRIYRDAYGRLIVECESKEKRIEFLEKTIRTLSNQTSSLVVTPNWAWVSLASNFLLLLISLLILIKRR